MVRRLLVILTFALMGCDALMLEPLPKRIAIESRFTEAAADCIRASIDVANAELGPLYGQDVLIYDGVVTDPNGFDMGDFGDESHIVYKVDKSSPEYGWLEDLNEKRMGGYGTAGDVLLFVEPDGDMVCNQGLILHELGHFMGLWHNPDPTSLMHPSHGASDFTDVDKDAFCLVRRCLP